MSDTQDYVRKEWAKVAAEELKLPRIRLTDLDHIGDWNHRKPAPNDEQCLICGAMDHEFIMFHGQRIIACPRCPEPMMFISLPSSPPASARISSEPS